VLQVKVLIERRESTFPPADLVIRRYMQIAVDLKSAGCERLSNSTALSGPASRAIR
jgi:hypothetical protein